MVEASRLCPALTLRLKPADFNRRVVRVERETDNQNDGQDDVHLRLDLHQSRPTAVAPKKAPQNSAQITVDSGKATIT